jgi:hypothetical protein
LDTFTYQRFLSDNPVTVGATATVDSSTCSATINGVDTRPSPTVVTATAAGGQFRVEIRPTDNILSGSARANQPWVRLESGSARRGSATLVFSANPNPSSTSRTASITIGRQVVDVRQDAASTPVIGGVVHGASFLPGTRRASSRWVLLLFGTGFEPSAAGALIYSPIPVSAPIRVFIGDREASVIYAGLVSPGMFQLNIMLPDLRPGSYALVVEVGGVRSPPGLMLPVE